VFRERKAVSDGTVRLTIDGPRASVVFDRVEAHNAMTWRMYSELADICTKLAQDRSAYFDSGNTLWRTDCKDAWQLPVCGQYGPACRRGGHR